jgi:hypothetical protein
MYGALPWFCRGRGMEKKDSFSHCMLSRGSLALVTRLAW